MQTPSGPDDPSPRNLVQQTVAVVGVIALLTAGMVVIISNGRRNADPSGAGPALPSIGTPVATTPAGTASPTPSSSPSPSASPDLRCHNSTDPACGPFRWTRHPGRNSPVRITITTSPAHPRVGDVVTFRVHVVDPDAPVNCCNIFSAVWGASGQSIVRCSHAPHGPWDPPARKRGEETLKFTHRFDKAGEFKIRFQAVRQSRTCASGSPSGSTIDGRPVNPYLSSGESSVVVHVAPGGTATPTPSETASPTPSETASPTPSETSSPYRS